MLFGDADAPVSPPAAPPLLPAAPAGPMPRSFDRFCARTGIEPPTTAPAIKTAIIVLCHTTAAPALLLGAVDHHDAFPGAAWLATSALAPLSPTLPLARPPPTLIATPFGPADEEPLRPLGLVSTRLDAVPECDRISAPGAFRSGKVCRC